MAQLQLVTSPQDVEAKAFQDDAPVHELIDRGAKLARDYARLQGRATQTARNLALVVLHLRARYRDKDGWPDLCGTSPGYREAVQQLYEKAGIPSDSEASLQSLIRYHVAALRIDYMRANGLYTPEALAHYGITPTPPKERQAERRERQRQRAETALRRLEAITVQPDSPPEDVVRAVSQLAEDVRNVTAARDAVSATVVLTGKPRETIQAAITSLEESVAVLRSALG